MNMPPPNMGGHPAGGPPGSGPPPQLDLSGEVWVEAKSGDGKSYFYNARTRETTWTKPEGNVKILLQEQVSSEKKILYFNRLFDFLFFFSVSDLLVKS